MDRRNEPGAIQTRRRAEEARHPGRPGGDRHRGVFDTLRAGRFGPFLFRGNCNREPATQDGCAAGRHPGRRSSTQAGVGRTAREYRPSLKPPKDMEPASIDPRLHLAALARLQDVAVAGTSRSLFEISAAPPAQQLAVAEPKPIKAGVHRHGPPRSSSAARAAAHSPRSAHSAQVLRLRESRAAGCEQAFFMENEDILIAGEGDIMKKRYKIIRIGVNSAEVEDTQFKGDNQAIAAAGSGVARMKRRRNPDSRCCWSSCWPPPSRSACTWRCRAWPSNPSASVSNWPSIAANSTNAGSAVLPEVQAYPQNLDDLETTRNIRFLRRRYKDPMTGKDAWRLIHVGPGVS